MGPLSSFLERRRSRESAPSVADPDPFGFGEEPSRPGTFRSDIARADAPDRSSGGPGPEEIVELLRMVRAALQTGQFQIHQSEAPREPSASGPGAESG